MTDPVPSKDLSIRPITNATSEGLVERLRWKWADHGMGHNSDYTADLMASADEIERLREALAQLEDQLRLSLDMDRAAHEPSARVRELAESAYRDGYGDAPSGDDDFSEHTHGLMRRLSHEPESAP